MILEDLPGRIGVIRQALEVLERGEPEGRELLERQAHNLAGLGGTIGQPLLGRIGALWERALKSYLGRPAPERALILQASREALSYLEELYEALRAGLPSPGEEHAAVRALSDATLCG